MNHSIPSLQTEQPTSIQSPYRQPMQFSSTRPKTHFDTYVDGGIELSPGAATAAKDFRFSEKRRAGDFAESARGLAGRRPRTSFPTRGARAL